MCYTGTCPYEGINGGCKLSDARLADPPADAWCSEIEDYDESDDENFRRIAVAVERINALTKEINGRAA